MPDSYPYIISNNKIEPILASIRSAAKPARFNREFLKKMGFAASNDRAIITVLRELGFVADNSAPTADYDRLRDPTQWRRVLGERVKDLYGDLFAIDTNIYSASDDKIKGAISRVTGKDDRSVARYFTTFKTLATLADFAAPSIPVREPDHSARNVADSSSHKTQRITPSGEPSFHYNIQIHLPATTDISVYNAIFKSMKEHLGIQ